MLVLEVAREADVHVAVDDRVAAARDFVLDFARRAVSVENDRGSGRIGGGVRLELRVSIAEGRFTSAGGREPGRGQNPDGTPF